MKIPFVDLKTQFEKIEGPIRAGIDAVLAHGSYIMGPEIATIEKALAAYSGVKHVLGCSSGTDALVMGLMAGKIGKGDAVFTTPFTFVATAEAIALVGATPVFVDIDEESFTIDPAPLQMAIDVTRAEGSLRPAAIIPVDLFGLPADYVAVETIAATEKLFLLEDACQGFGGAIGERKACSFGDIGATSFFPAKPLGCYGDGGAVFTNNDDLAELLLSIRVHGQGEAGDKYQNVRIGINGRLDSIQAAILIEKMKIFPDELLERQRVAERYTAGLMNLVTTPTIPAGVQSAWAQYSILTDRRDELREALGKADIPSAIYYPVPLHLQPAFGSLGYADGDFPVSEKTAGRIMSLPMSPYFADGTIDTIITVIQETLG